MTGPRPLRSNPGWEAGRSAGRACRRTRWTSGHRPGTRRGCSPVGPAGSRQRPGGLGLRHQAAAPPVPFRVAAEREVALVDHAAASAARPDPAEVAGQPSPRARRSSWRRAGPAGLTSARPAPPTSRGTVGGEATRCPRGSGRDDQPAPSSCSVSATVASSRWIWIRGGRRRQRSRMHTRGSPLPRPPTFHDLLVKAIRALATDSNGPHSTDSPAASSSATRAERRGQKSIPVPQTRSPWRSAGMLMSSFPTTSPRRPESPSPSEADVDGRAVQGVPRSRLTRGFRAPDTENRQP